MAKKKAKKKTKKPAAKKPAKKATKKVAKKAAKKVAKKKTAKKAAKKVAKKKVVKKAAKKVAKKKAAKKVAKKKVAKKAVKKATKKVVKKAAVKKAPAKKAEKKAAPKKAEKVAKKAEKKAKKEAPVEVEEIVEIENEEEVVLTDADGNQYCRASGCDQIAVVEGYCRYHYLLFWKRIQARKKILSEGKLERYIEDLTSRYPDKHLEMLRKDLKSDKDFLAAVQELEIDDSGVDSEYEDEAQSYIEEVRGVSDTSNARDDDEY